MAARAPSPQTVVSAPAAVAVGYRSWLVPMQNGFVRFMYTDGHGDLTCYNFAVLMTHKDKELVDDVPYRNGFTDIVSDSFKLTEAGEAALSEAAGVALAPSRFRPNVVIEGPPAWEEFKWVGRVIQLGDATLQGRPTL